GGGRGRVLARAVVRLVPARQRARRRGRSRRGQRPGHRRPRGLRPDFPRPRQRPAPRSPARERGGPRRRRRPAAALPARAAPPPSATFHGRDVFAPLAAGLASGALELAALGPPATPLASALPAPVTDDEAVHGAVITVDRFGNLITNLERASVEAEHARYVLL